MYGYQEVKTAGQGANLKFGLNKDAKLVKFAFNPNGGSQGSLSNCIDIAINIGGTEVRTRIFEVLGAPDKNLAVGTPEYQASFKKAVDKSCAYICSYLECYIPEDRVKTALSRPFSGFAEYAQTCEALLKSVPNVPNIPVDVFLQYQYSISQGQKMTFLELPRTAGYGKFIIKSVPGNFTEVKTPSSLTYVNEANEVHPFQRNEFFLKQPASKQQKLEGDSSYPTAYGNTASVYGANDLTSEEVSDDSPW